MEDVLVALLAIFGTLIVGLLGVVGALMRRNNRNGNPGSLFREMQGRFDRLEDHIDRATDRIVAAVKEYR